MWTGFNTSVNSFAAAGDYSRQRALSAGVDRSRHILRASEIYHILHYNGLLKTTHCGVLSKKLIGSERVKAQIHYTSFPVKSVTSWQLPRLRGSYGEAGAMNFGHQ